MKNNFFLFLNLKNNLLPKFAFLLFLTSFLEITCYGQMPKPMTNKFPQADWHFPTLTLQNQQQKDTTAFKPSVQFGALLQTVGVLREVELTAAQDANPNFNQRWTKQMNIYRARILLGGNITPKTSFFIETDIATPIGFTDNAGNKAMQVNPIILDAQIEHNFSKKIGMIAGMMLVGNTRNALQGAASLLALDFGYYQYPYNLFQTSPLQNNFGRDIGLNVRGFLANDRLEYRIGAFSGRNIDPLGTLRYIGRLNYNFLDKEQDLYYTGTTLGKGKILAIGGGFDMQDRYQSFAIDGFLDMPLGESGSITANAAFTYINGGDNVSVRALSRYIPTQTIQFLELGYYIKSAKLQPYLKYEAQNIAATTTQAGNLSTSIYNDLLSKRRAGFGLNYYLSGYNANIKLLYENVGYGRLNVSNTNAETISRSEIWLQFQIFIF
jgi:hypothetical protein